MTQRLIDLILVGVLIVVAPRAIAAPSIPASVQDAIVESLSETHHTTTVTLSGLDSNYFVPTPDDPIENERLIFRNPDPRVWAVLKLDVAGRPDLSSVEGMLGSILTASMSPEQRAVAIWNFVVAWRYHYIPAQEGDEVNDPIKLINVYGYGFCDNSAHAIEVLSKAAGMPARVVGLSGHTVAEVQFGGAWHMLDADHEVIYRANDGHILSVDELAADPSPILATPLDPVDTDTALMASLYTSTADNSVYPPAPMQTARIMPVLWPLDEVVFDLAPGTVYSESAAERAANPEYGPPPVFANGTLTRQIDFSQAANEKVIPIAWPFLIVGADLNLDFAQADADAEISINCGGTNYDVVPATRADQTLSASLSAWFAARQIGAYTCNLKVRSLSSAPLNEVVTSGEVRWKFQYAPRALQQLESGGTSLHAAVAPVFGSVPADWMGIEIVHEWAEPHHFLRSGAQRWSQDASLPTQLIEAAASFEADAVVLTLLTAGDSGSNLLVALDTDLYAGTGYQHPGMGSDFMVSNGRLYKYTGPPGVTPTPWSWSNVAPVDVVALRNDIVQFKIPRSSLDLRDGGRLDVRVQSWQAWTTLLDELPRSDARWQVSVPYGVRQSGSADTDVVLGQVAFDPSRMLVTLQTVASATEELSIYLDTDSNAGTGYKTDSLGAEFLISGGFLYRYTGTAPGEWSWGSVGPVTLDSSDTNLLQVGIPRAPLGLGSGARVTLRADSWRDWTTKLDTLPRVGRWQAIAPNVITQSGTADGDLIAGEATFQSKSVLFTLETFGQPIQHFHLLLNTDANIGTGYIHRAFGSDYMIEDDTLYRFVGQTAWEWSWTPIGSVQLRRTSPDTLEVVVPTVAMNLTNGRGSALVENWLDWNTLLDSMPASAGWQLGW